MRNHLLLLLLLTTFFIPILNVNGFHIDNLCQSTKPIDQENYIHKHAASFFTPITNPFEHESISTSPYALAQAAKDTLYYIKNKRGDFRQALEPSNFKNIISFKQVVQTLKFIIKIIEADKKTGNFRILDPKFINKNFSFIKWKADIESAHKNNINLHNNGNIRLTNYVIYNVHGSLRKTKTHKCPLYNLQDRKLANKFSKQEILSGVLEKSNYKNKVHALAWLTRTDFEDVLLQGSVLINFPNNSHKIFMVDVCNGIDYIKGLHDQKKQNRYWYYREAKSNIDSLMLFQKRIISRKNVIFAGDIYNIGIGKIIALSHMNQVTKKSEIILGVLADTGGAFVNNLYQLDLFLGMFNDKKSLKQQQQRFPETTQAYIMYKTA